MYTHLLTYLLTYLQLTLQQIVYLLKVEKLTFQMSSKRKLWPIGRSRIFLWYNPLAHKQASTVMSYNVVAYLYIKSKAVECMSVHIHLSDVLADRLSAA